MPTNRKSQPVEPYNLANNPEKVALTTHLFEKIQKYYVNALDEGHVWEDFGPMVIEINLSILCSLTMNVLRALEKEFKGKYGSVADRNELLQVLFHHVNRNFNRN